MNRKDHASESGDGVSSALPNDMDAVCIVGKRVPLALAQRRIWFLSTIDEASAEAYVVSVGMRLVGALDVVALRAALDVLLRRHDALRARIEIVDGEPKLCLANTEQACFALAEDNLRDADDPAACLDRLVETEFAAPFDLEHGPLIRGRLVTIRDNEYAWLLTVHHVIFDGTSMYRFARELSMAYRALRSGEQPVLEEARSFADCAALQRGDDFSKSLLTQAKFWREELRGAPSISTLPSDRVRHAQHDFDGALVDWKLSAELTARLRTLAKRHRTTLFCVLLAAWATLIRRLNQEDEAVVGVTTNGRTRREFRNVVGCFVGTVPIRIGGSATPANVIRQTTERLRAAGNNQDLPFEQIVDAARVERNLAQNPLFQTLINWYGTDLEPFDFGDVERLPLPSVGRKFGLFDGGESLNQTQRDAMILYGGTAERTVAKLDVTLFAWDAAGLVHLGAEYARALFDGATITYYLGCWTRLLEAFAMDDAQAISHISLIHPDEQRRMILDWNATRVTRPAASLPELFAESARRWPHETALRFNDVSLSYSALSDQVCRMAHQLRSLGIGAGQRVAVALERGPSLVAALLAVLECSAAYVPIDPQHPLDRRLHVVRDVTASALIVHGTTDLAEPLQTELTIVDLANTHNWSEPLCNSDARPPAQHDLAYVIYTSGTTGLPKGVMVEHASVVNLLLAMRDTLSVVAGDRVLALTTVGFDIAALELFLPLIAGGCIVLADRDAAVDPSKLAALISTECVDVMQATPTTWRMLLDSGWRGIPSIRALCGGEALPGGLAAKIVEKVGALWNVYGPTETTIWSTAQRVDAMEIDDVDATVCIGTPLANTQSYVLDSNAELVPVGAIGELYLGGTGLARGYVGLDALTQERFVANPFFVEGCLYRTGDLVYRDRDGRLHHVGRTDAQVKLNGYRIELEEIEARLVTHCAVLEAVVTLRRDAAGYARLVAYYVATIGLVDSVEDRTETLRSHLLAFLPSYMVPEVFVALERLPVSPNGKIDRIALPDPVLTARSGHEAPRGGMESAVAAVWSDLLDGRTIDRRDNFFRLGGHSLLAVRVAARLRQVLGVDVNVVDLFVYPTLEAFAAVVARAEKAAMPPLVTVTRDNLQQLSSAQQRLWFVAQANSAASRAYHMPIVLNLRGNLDRVALERSVSAIVTRHEALRTVFPAREGRPVQHVVAAEDVRVRVRVAELLEASETEIEAAIVDEVDRAFDLQMDLPVRVMLLRSAPDVHVAVFTIHHIACDGWSLALFLRELEAHYRAVLHRSVAELPELVVQYADFSAWERAAQTTTRFARTKLYWAQRLSGAPELFELPTDRPRPATQDFSGSFVDCELGRALTDGLNQLAERCGATLFVTVLAGWVALLARLSGARDFVVGTPTANRDSSEIEHLIGFFANALALRFELAHDPTVVELVALTRNEVLAAQQNREQPFEQLVEVLRPTRSASYTPVFQIAFAWQSVPPFEPVLEGLEVKQRFFAGTNTAKFDLTLYLWQSDNGLSGGIEYATSLFDSSTIAGYLSHWQELLRTFVIDPQCRLMQLPLLSHAQRDALLNSLSRGSPVSFDARRVDALVADVARQQPAAPAVTYNERVLDYGTLERRAERLSRRLVRHGATAGTRVGVLMPRTPELVIALLGVLRSGAAYVLLDPVLPPQRLVRMLIDADARAIVCGTAAPSELRDSGLSLPIVVVADDGETDDTQFERRRPVDAGKCDKDIAYAVYTSGSTGMPKGVLITHSGLTSLVHAVREEFGLRRGDRVSWACGLAFDASTIDIWPALCAGATLVSAPVELAQDPDAFLRWWSAQPLDCSLLPTPIAEIIVGHGLASATLRTLATGGAALTRVPPATATYRLLNVYGPAEATVVTTIGEVRHGDRITIGRPIANVHVYILDDAGAPQPIGIPGELCVGGIGVGAGYLGLPDLNESRFPLDPFSPIDGARLYRSGDRARWLADGRIEFLGRRDEQVKLRGMRIELGEIETALAELSVVREAAVRLVTNVAGEARLAAYLSVHETAANEESIVGWQRVYDATYSGLNRDALSDFDGWNSSYTGEPIALAEMRQWQEETVTRVRALNPRRVLEIGCGSGLLLMPLATTCERYVGIDLSEQALLNLQRKVDRVGIAGVELVHARADELHRLVPELFDTVIINSVAQYFPDRAYLDRVIADARARLKPAGALFVGDLRNQLLAEPFHRSVLRARGARSTRTDYSEDHIHRAVGQEKELLVAPAYFRRLVGDASQLQILPKTVSNTNELTAFRYDVIIRNASAEEVSRQVFDAKDSTSVVAAAEWARRHPYGVAVVTPLRNTLVGDVPSEDGTWRLTPAEAVERVAKMGLTAQASWLGSDVHGSFHLLIAAVSERLCDHVAILRDSVEPDGESTNVPARPASEVRLRNELVAALSRQLPDYMIPTQFVFLARLPLSANGKVDRARLPLVELPRPEASRPLQTPTEHQVAAIWSEVVGNKVLGAGDHFFDLGGHSLAAVQVLARVRETLGIEVTLADLFAHPVLADFSDHLQHATPAPQTAVNRVSREAPLSLSFEQEGLWFVAKLPGAAAYNMVVAYQLDGVLDVAAMRSAVDALVQRHEALRTRFAEIDGRPMMHIDVNLIPALRVTDIADAAQQHLQCMLNEEIDHEFDLEAAPPIRISLLRETNQRHVLVLSMHHILGDGWSIDILLRDLGRYYDVAVGARRSPPTPLSVQYADFASAQRSIELNRLERLAAHWRGVLDGAPPLLELPADRLRPTQQDFRGSFLPCLLDRALSERTHQASRRFETTPFVLMLTSWALLLSRLSGSDDIVVGIPSANRSTPQTQDLVGLLVSTLPLRLDLAGSSRLSALLKQVERCMLDAQQHQDIAFEKIVELVCSARSLAHNPIFQVMFAWQGERPEPLHLHGLTTTVLRPDSSPRHAKFDLSLILADHADGIHGGLEYSDALFDASTIERFRDHWLSILTRLVAGDDVETKRIELLSPSQRADMLQRWNSTARDFPSDLCLHTLFEAQVEATPEATALEFEEQSLTYAELNLRTDRLAARLRAHGVREGTFVAIHIARSPAMIVAVLATLKAGGAYVPLETTHPFARKTHILEDCQPAWLLHAGDAPALGHLAEPPLLIHVNLAGDDPPVLISRRSSVSSQLAYLIYTSGSTGRPKGVMVEHRSVVNRLFWMLRHFSIGADDRVLQKTALGFDVSVWEIFVPLICGGCLVLAGAGAQADPERLSHLLCKRRVSVAHFVPSMLHIFLAQLDSAVFPDLRHVICSGEELPPTTVEDFQNKLPHTAIYNLYGPTEASIEVSWHRCELDHSAVRVPIGQPIDNCQLYVLDREHRLLPPGVTGELYIGGTPVARGYFNRPTLTAERFLSDPFVTDPHARIYKTGDRARRLPNGEIDFLGRSDAQIKLRGFRIELSEIESHFARYPGVDDALVSLYHDAVLGPILIGYWVGDRTVDAQDLRDYLAAAVPDYMVPTHFVPLASLPLNANGKLDRSALPAPDTTVASPLVRAPEGELERLVASAWYDVLGRNDVGRDDNFFVVGGHSLLTLRLRTRLRSVGCSADIGDIFRYPTIATFARAVAGRDAKVSSCAIATVRADGDAPPLFLLHDGFGLTLYAHVLGAQLPRGFPIYALDDPTAAWDATASIPLLADHMLMTLRATQPRGPYRLAGWSFGGVLAYEIATRLVDAGEAVEYLALIDSYYQFDEPMTDERPVEFAEVPLHVAALDPAHRNACLTRHTIYALAARRYVARPLHVPICLIKAQRCDFPAMQAYRGWERVLPVEAIRLQEVPGCHYSMMTPPLVADTVAAIAKGLANL